VLKYRRSFAFVLPFVSIHVGGVIVLDTVLDHAMSFDGAIPLAASLVSTSSMLPSFVFHLAILEDVIGVKIS